MFRSAGSARPMRSPRPWCFSHPTTAATSRERNCLWTAASHKCKPRTNFNESSNHEEKHMSQNGSRPTALITGGTSGIGLATARILHEQGFAVLVTGQNPETIAAAQRSLPAEFAVLRTDARILADADRVAGELKQRFGRIHFAFLNAGIIRMLPLEAVDEAAFDEHFDINVKGQFFALQKILPLLAEGGSVLFAQKISELTGKQASYHNIPEEAAKQGMLAVGMPLPLVESMLSYYVAGIRNGKMYAPTSTIRDVLGRPARSFDEWVRDHRAMLA